MSDRLTDKHWDFILCSLASWIQVGNILYKLTAGKLYHSDDDK